MTLNCYSANDLSIVSRRYCNTAFIDVFFSN